MSRAPAGTGALSFFVLGLELLAVLSCSLLHGLQCHVMSMSLCVHECQVSAFVFSLFLACLVAAFVLLSRVFFPPLVVLSCSSLPCLTSKPPSIEVRLKVLPLERRPPHVPDRFDEPLLLWVLLPQAWKPEVSPSFIAVRRKASLKRLCFDISCLGFHFAELPTCFGQDDSQHVGFQYLPVLYCLQAALRSSEFVFARVTPCSITQQPRVHY